MSSESPFDKKYNPQSTEQEILKFWQKQAIFKFDPTSQKPLFSIDTPPPTISGKMHIGHAYSYAQQDFFARYKKMKGFEVFYPFGTDDNGLPTEKLVQKERKVNLRKVSREEAVKITMEFLAEERPKFIADWQELGMSCDFDICYSSIDLNSQKIAQKTFLELNEKGLVERRKGPIPWDRVFQTTIAQAELEDKEVQSFMHYIKAKMVGTKNTYILYATTRPEMIFACHGFSVEDKGKYVKVKIGEEFWITGAATYKEKLEKIGVAFEVVEELSGQEIIGEKVCIPLINREIEITHDVAIKADLGTGSAYFCSFGGVEDISYVKRHNAPIYEILTKDGKLNQLCGEFEGLVASMEGRKEVAKALENNQTLIFSEPITHIVNVGERSGVEVEYIASEQWFVRYLDHKEQLWEQAQQLNWVPEHMKHRLENWIKGLQWDWGISRQRHFGIPIPVWYCTNCNEPVYAKEEQLPVDPTTTQPPIKACPKCKAESFKPEEDVFDTWFTSASSPQLAIGLVENKEIQKQLYPMDLRPQGHDIINFWLFYTHAKANVLYEKNAWKNAIINGWVLAPDGTKMSKSKGNTIAPQQIVEKYSNDALRFAAASAKLGHDLPYQEKEVQTGYKVTMKIYNACKFASLLLKDLSPKEKEITRLSEIRSIDRWIIAKFQECAKAASESFDRFDYTHPKTRFEQFFMRDVADNYLEIVKQRLWQPDVVGKEETKKAQKTLYYVLFGAMRGLAPILPFITEEVYQKFFKNFESYLSIHKAPYPQEDKQLSDSKAVELGDQFVQIVSEVRKFKAEHQMSMKEPLEKIEVMCSDELKHFIEDSLTDLEQVTNTKTIVFKQGEFFVKLK